MNYKQLKTHLETELPINRKERFYTGTVLPSILFHKGLSNLFLFLNQIKGFPASINEDSAKDHILFYTEYNLKESAGKKSVGVEIEADRRDTPDVLIQIVKPEKVFVVIEAKMFVNLTQADFGKQITAQKETITEPLKKQYSGCQVFHVGLVPAGLKFDSKAEYQIINWEILKDEKLFDLEGNYFVNYLKYALEHYHRLVSDKAWNPSTAEDKKTGAVIYEEVKDGKRLWVGRDGGRPKIEEDVKTGTWRRRLYFTNSQKPGDGREGNWISGIEFRGLVESREEV